MGEEAWGHVDRGVNVEPVEEDCDSRRCRVTENLHRCAWVWRVGYVAGWGSSETCFTCVVDLYMAS